MIREEHQQAFWEMNEAVPILEHCVGVGLSCNLSTWHASSRSGAVVLTPLQATRNLVRPWILASTPELKDEYDPLQYTNLILEHLSRTDH